MLFAQNGPWALALASDPGPLRQGVGYVGASGGWQDFAANGRIDLKIRAHRCRQRGRHDRAGARRWRGPARPRVRGPARGGRARGVCRAGRPVRERLGRVPRQLGRVHPNRRRPARRPAAGRARPGPDLGGRAAVAPGPDPAGRDRGQPVHPVGQHPQRPGRLPPGVVA